MRDPHEVSAAPPGRRRFLRDAARWLVALGLGGGVVALSDRSVGTCLQDGRCHGCPQLEGCDLPAAEAAREGRDRLPGAR